MVAQAATGLLLPAGATADAFTLFERLELKLEEHPGQLTRAAVELAKAWRTDKFLRRLDVCGTPTTMLPDHVACRTVEVARRLNTRHDERDGQALTFEHQCDVQAVMIVADSKHSLQITGNGDVLEPHDGIIGEVLPQRDLN